MHSFFAVCALKTDCAVAHVTIDSFKTLCTILARVAAALTNCCIGKQMTKTFAEDQSKGVSQRQRK